jgi:hypothetical protein
VVATGLPFRSAAVPFSEIGAHWQIIMNLLAGSLLLERIFRTSTGKASRRRFRAFDHRHSKGQAGRCVALAGYGIDRQYVLSVHKGCAAKVDWPDRGTITHMCDSAPGESGGPILLLRDADTALIGIQSANEQRFQPNVGYRAVIGRGVSASEFAKAAGASTPDIISPV